MNWNRVLAVTARSSEHDIRFTNFYSEIRKSVYQTNLDLLRENVISKSSGPGFTGRMSELTQSPKYDYIIENVRTFFSLSKKWDAFH